MPNLFSPISQLKSWTRRHSMWLWLAISVIGLLSLIFINAATPLYKRYKQLDGSGLKELGYIYYARTVIKPLFQDSAAILGNVFESMLDIKAQPDRSKLEAIHIKLPGGALEKMASSLPESAKEKYYKGQLLYPNGVWGKAKVRFRGRNLHHWMPDKPSLRVKIPKSKALNMQRNINLLNPEDRAMVANPLGYWLGIELGVMTHLTRYVRLYINNDYFGVYHSTTRDDEEMIRLNERIPGPLFVGDRVKKKWTPEKFEVSGEVKILKYFDPLSQLTEAMYIVASPERYTKLWQILSMEKMARWQATMNLAGGIHTDSYHNHLYYFDPSSGLLEPIIVDINGFGLLTQPYGDLKIESVSNFEIPFNDNLQPLLNVALRDPRFYHLRNEILYETLSGGVASKEKVLDELERIRQRTFPDIEADKRKASLLRSKLVSFFRIPYSNRQYNLAIDNLRTWIEKRYEFLEKHLSTAKVTVLVAPKSDGHSNFLVQVGGHVAVRFNPAELTTPVQADTQLNGTFKTNVESPMKLYPGLEENEEFIYRWTNNKRRNQTPYQLVEGLQNYLFQTGSITKEEIVKSLSGAFQHALSGQPISPEIQFVNSLSVDDALPNGVSLHVWRFPIQNTDAVVLGPGEVILDKDLFIPESGRLEILPGTLIRLQPGVSIISQGPLKMEGTDDNPIRLERADPDRAWGVLAIHGQASSNSRITHANFSGGSLATHLNVRYSGMLSVHWSKDFYLADSKLSSNVESDDLLHIVHGNAIIQRVSFSDCFADCIDLDYSAGTLTDAKFYKSGNDGIDFMTSQFKLNRIMVNSAEDKGFSIGEKSVVEIENSQVINSQTGLAVKDGSKATVRNSLFDKNYIAISLSKKNWRYGGPGKIHIQGVQFSNNQVNMVSEEGALITLFQQTMFDRVVGDGQVISKK